MSTQYPGWLAGQRVTAQRISDSLPQFVYKNAHTDRVSTTTLTNDPDLWFTVEANAMYVIEFHLFMGGGTTGKPMTDWAVPADADGLKGVQGPSSTIAGSSNGMDNVTMRSGSHGFSTDVIYGTRNLFSNLSYITEIGTVYTTTAGTVAVRWAQSVSSTTAVRMGLGSWARCTRVG